MQYRVVTASGVKNYPDRLSLIAVWGSQLTGFQEQNPSSRIQIREELVGQPEFGGLVGPMWGGMLDEHGGYVFDGSGSPCVRYEDQQTYNEQSS